MRRVILGYNNSIHCVMNFTPFEIIKGYLNGDNPDDFGVHLIISNYKQNHRETDQATLQRDQKKNQQKRKLFRISTWAEITDLCQTKNMNTKVRDKKLPKFNKETIINQTDKKIKTDCETYHKNIYKNSNLLRDFYYIQQKKLLTILMIQALLRASNTEDVENFHNQKPYSFYRARQNQTYFQ